MLGATLYSGIAGRMSNRREANGNRTRFGQSSSPNQSSRVDSKWSETGPIRSKTGIYARRNLSLQLTLFKFCVA